MARMSISKTCLVSRPLMPQGKTLRGPLDIKKELHFIHLLNIIACHSTDATIIVQVWRLFLRRKPIFFLECVNQCIIRCKSQKYTTFFSRGPLGPKGGGMVLIVLRLWLFYNDMFECQCQCEWVIVNKLN